MKALYDYEDRFGIPVDFFLPRQKGVIMIADPLPSKITQRALTAVCRKSEMKLVYIVPKGGQIYNNCHCITLIDDSPETWSEALQVAMNVMGIDIDIRRDREEIYEFNEKRGY